MNWKRGFFRVWVVVSVSWLAFASWDLFNDFGSKIAQKTESIRKMTSNDPNLKLEVLRVEKARGPHEVCLEVDFNPLRVGLTEEEDRFVPIYCELPESLLRQIDFRKFDPDAYLQKQGQMYGLGLEDARTHVLKILRSERYSLFGHLSLMLVFFVLLPPLLLLALWFLYSWILVGFRGKS